MFLLISLILGQKNTSEFENSDSALSYRSTN
ncbi:hypothetical protein LINPERPRIM_LOCUS30458 [Linum perenne]